MSDFGDLDQANRHIQGPILGNAHASEYSSISQIGTVFAENFYSSNSGNVSVKPSDRPWTIPRGVNRLFTGREDILETLSRAFHEDNRLTSDTERRFVIAGLGGTGKSEVCIKYAVDHRSSYWGVFWVDCASEETVKESFKRIGNVCGIESSVENVKSWLSSTSQRWLLIIDNADDIRVNYSDFFPYSSNSDIIVTTRNFNLCRTYATVGSEVLDQLDFSLAEDLLLRATKVPEGEWSTQREIAKCLVKELGRHTLAILHTAACIVESRISINEYMEMLQQQREEELETIIFESTRDQEHATYATVNLTFEISLKRIETLQRKGDPTAADALDLLNILAFLHYQGDIRMVALAARSYTKQLDSGRENVWADFFKPSASHVDLLPRYYMRSVDDLTGKRRWNKAHRMLEAFSFVRIEDQYRMDIASVPNLEVSKMHPLVHTWARQRQDFETKRISWLKAATTIACAGAIGPGQSPVYEIVQPHVRVCVTQDIQQYTDASQANIIAPLMWQFLMIQTDLIVDFKMEQLISILRSLLEKELEHTNVASHDLELAESNLLWIEGKWMHRRGELAKAVEQLEQVVLLQEKLVKEDHPAIIASKGDLASAYRANGQLNKAVGPLKDIIRIRGDEFGEEQPAYLEAQRELATVYSLNRQPKEAVSLLEKVVDVQRRIYYETHHSVVLSEQSLALAYLDTLDRSNMDKAVELLEKVVSIAELSHDEGHRERLVYQHSLGVAYTHSEQYAKAIAILEHVREVRQRVLEEHNPLRLASEGTLANAYLLSGQQKKAIMMLKQIDRAGRVTWPEDHFERLNMETSLGIAYMRNRENEEAFKLFQHVVSVRGKSLSDDHPDLLESQWQLARVHRYRKDLKEALRLLKHVIHLEEAKEDPATEKVVMMKLDLYKVYKARRNFKKAMKVYREIKAFVEQKKAVDV